MKNAAKFRARKPEGASLLAPLPIGPGIGLATPLQSLANERPVDAESLVGLGNEIGTVDAGNGWALIPYGETINRRGGRDYVQRFGRPEAEEMVRYFKTTWARIKRAFVGMPIFRGHPDQAEQVARERDREKDPAKRAALTALVNEIVARYPDKTVYGTVADMEARDDGLAIKPILTEAGVALVNDDGLTSFSPHWLGRTLPVENGREIRAPIYLVSIGLTNRPNIAGTSLVNSKPEPTTMNKVLLIQLLAALGRTSLANEATDEQINAEIQAAIPVAQGLATRPESTALANEQTARTTAEGELAQVKAKLGETETALANERTAHTATAKARNEALVDGAIRAGRITEAQRPIWLGRLGRDFGAESIALANEVASAVKTEARTKDLGARKPTNAAGDEFTSLVNERMSKHGESWDAAWAAVKESPKGKELFALMDQPAS